MKSPLRKSRPGILLALWLVVGVSSARAEGSGSISGAYRCDYGCRLTDAAPAIKIDADVAICWNELGGIFHGRLLTADTIACFNKTGTLSSDGTTIHWSDGVVWKKLSGSPL